jgi:hypothetical protein
MNGLRFLFPGPTKLWIIIIGFFLLAIGCSDGCRCNGCGCNGCTTSVVIDQESRKIKIDDLKIKVIANKNRVTNRKLRLDSTLYVDKTIWYTVDYNVRIDDRPEIKNICELEASENQDLEKSLDKFNIQFSPDEKHFAVGIDSKVYDFFHLLPDEVPFSSGCYYLNDSISTYLETANLNFKDIKWIRFPSPNKLLDEIIVPNLYSPWALECNQKNVLRILSDLPSGNEHDIVLINNWYCEIADIHFNQQRVQNTIKVSPTWKTAASKSLIKYIGKSIEENDPKLKSSLDMVLWINDINLLNKADSVIFDDYFASGYAGTYFLSRFNNTQFPVNKIISNKILDEAKKICSNPEAYPDKMSLETAVDVLVFKKEFNELKAFLEKNLNLESLENFKLDILTVTIRKYDKYPKDLQLIIVNNCHKIVQNPSDLSAFDVSEIMEFLKDKISCTDLKKLVEIHKDKLVGFMMPKNCH